VPDAKAGTEASNYRQQRGAVGWWPEAAPRMSEKTA
jgi:hypothetical protein